MGRRGNLAVPMLWTGCCPNGIQLCWRWSEMTSRIRVLCSGHVLSVVKGLCASYWRGPMNSSQSRLSKVTHFRQLESTLWKCCSVITLYDPGCACVSRQLWRECCRHLMRFMLGYAIALRLNRVSLGPCLRNRFPLFDPFLMPTS